MSKNADRLMSTGMPATQAKEVVTQIEAAASGDVAWGDVTGKPATFPPTVGTTATTALAGSTPLLAIGTTATTALAGNGVPNAQIPSISTAGGAVIAPGTLLEVLQAIADLADPAP